MKTDKVSKVGESHIKFEDVEKNYYFTFGQANIQNDGTPMRNYWVRVVAEDFMKARMMFIEKFSSVHMPTPTTWSFQYTEDDFDRSWFPSGEYALIQNNKLSSPYVVESSTKNIDDILNQTGEQN